MPSASSLSANKGLIFISQPYYNIVGEKKFKKFLQGFINYIDTNKFSTLYIKLHPSEDTTIYNKYYKELGFINFLPKCNLPMEVILQHIPQFYTIISFNSSVLINAQSFGFQGKVISFGLNWINSNIKCNGDFLKNHIRIFKLKNVEIFFKDF